MQTRPGTPISSSFGTGQAWKKNLFSKLSTFQSSVLIPQIHHLKDTVNNSIDVTLYLHTATTHTTNHLHVYCSVIPQTLLMQEHYVNTALNSRHSKIPILDLGKTSLPWSAHVRMSISGLGCVTHMDPTYLDHKALWGNENQAPSWEGGAKVGSTHQKGTMCLALQGTPGPRSNGDNAAAGGCSGNGGVKNILWHSSAISGHKLQDQGKSATSLSYSGLKSTDLKQRLKLGRGALWLTLRGQRWSPLMLRWTTTGISTEFAETNQTKFIFS